MIHQISQPIIEEIEELANKNQQKKILVQE